MNQEKMLELYNSENLEEKLKELSYEDRLTIFTSELYIAELLRNKLMSEKIVLFNEEESIKIFNNYRVNYAEFAPLNIRLLKLPDAVLLKKYISSGSNNYLKFVKKPSMLLDMEGVDEYSIIDAVRFFSDDELEKLLKNPKYRKHYSEIVFAFDSDDKKIKYMYKVKTDERYYLIATLSDENIKKYINRVIVGKGKIISILKNDEEKYQYLEQYKRFMTDVDIARIVASFKDENYIYKTMSYLKSEKSYYTFIKNISIRNKIRDSELYKNILLFINNERYILNFFDGTVNIKADLDTKKKMIEKVTNSNYLYKIFEYDESLYSFILPRLEQKYIKKYVKENVEFLSDYHILIYLEDSKLLLDTLKHYNINEEYNDDMLPIFKKVAEAYNLNLEHLITLAKIGNCSILSMVTNENIINAINLDEVDFQKYIKIFDEKNIIEDSNALYSVLSSLLNKKFEIENPEKKDIFINTLHDVYDKKYESAIQKIREVLSVVDISKYNITALKLISGVLKGDKEVIKIYNRMTYEYLAIERNKYVNNIINDFLLIITSPKYEINDLVKFMLKNLQVEDLIKILKTSKRDFTPIEEEILNNEKLLLILINFKKYPNQELDSKYRKYLKPFNSILKKIFSDAKYINCSNMNIDGINIQYGLNKIRKRDLIEIMSNIDVIKLKELVFGNPELYKKMLDYLDKYDVLGWPRNFEEISSHADVDMTPDLVCSMINNFEFINKQKEEKQKQGDRFTLMSEIILADCLDSDASIYSYLFGREDYRLLRRNPSPNASPEGKKKRLQKAIKCLNVMHSRKYITVPPVNKDFKLSGNKRINIIIGNTNDPINLTYGERTGACMRIGGAGNSLFEFCLKNENGFHISFNNPDTGELISRVSCYRNGNTVFLNQLRNSLDPDFYPNELIREACGLIGKEIIENTKNSKYPVLNVVSTNDYAYSGCSLTNTDCKNPTKGFFPLFYTDIDESVVVVATASGTLSPIKLGPDKAERYKVGRAPIKKYDLNKASKAVARIEALDSYFSNVPIDEIEIEEKEIIVAYVGEDWYVALTSDNKIISYVQKNSRDNKIAMKEMEKYLNIMKDYIDYYRTDQKSRRQI